MNSNNLHNVLKVALAAWLMLCAATLPAAAGNMTTGTTAPPVNEFDIANLGARAGEDKFWAEAGTLAGTAHGQTFRTGSEALFLRSVTYRINAGNEADPVKTYVVRVGKVTGTAFAQIHTETFTQSIQWLENRYMTYTFTNPVLLTGDGTYGVDIGMTNSTVSFSTGIPYLQTTANEYLDGQFYTSGGTTAGVGSNNLTYTVNRDRHFHLDLTPPAGTPLAFIAGNPADGTAGNLVRPEVLATFNQNLTKGSGSIVIRDLTNPAAITSVTIPITDPRITITNNNLRIASPGLFTWNLKYAIRISPGALLGSGGVAFPGWADDTTWNFNMSAADPLLAAIAALKNHINGTAVLTAAQIATHSRTLSSEATRFGDNAANITAVFDLIKTYDTVVGPLWVVGGDLDRDLVADDVPWTIYRTMQSIMDSIYNPPTLAAHETLIAGYKFGSSSRFPGNCPVPPAGQTHTVAINASFVDTFGRTTQGWGEDARRPTGTYLAPGTIATVAVPAALVGKGYQVRVGAHAWDNSNRPNVKRLDRCTLLWDITAPTTKIASPLGGGIYIEVPRGRTAGVVDVTITGAARSPYFSAKNFHQTTPAEWLTERTHPGPWADFQSEKFMFQVPRSWIFARPDPTALMANWDKAMDAMNDLMGFPQNRGKETMYDQIDLQLRAAVFAPGYPAVNGSYNPSTTYNGNSTHYLLTGPQNAPDYEFHEAGHGYGFPKFPGEQESTVNLLHIAVQTQKFGKSFDQALRDSNGYNDFCTLPNTAVVWMTSFNFSPEEDPMDDWEKSYQPQGHAKFADLARLFGWGGLNAFYYYYNDRDERGLSTPEDTDSLILQLCKSYAKDVRPLLHFWGIHPVNATTLRNNITTLRLKPPVEIYDRILQYKGLIPTNNATYRTWCTAWWGGRLPAITGFGVEREHARQLTTTLQNGTAPQTRFPNEIYDEAAAAQVNARVQELLDLYYPAGRDYALWDADYPTLDLTNPTADLDRDGLTNDHERIWGLDPSSAASRQPVTSVAGQGTLTYTRRTSTLSGLNFTVWTSPDLATWTPDTTATQTVASTADNVQTITVGLSPALRPLPKIFVRIRAAP
jgi:N-terminal domain of M60-like peptidases/Peptidase M60, enhancin and enhancin-like